MLTIIIPKNGRPEYSAFGKARGLYPTPKGCGLYARYCNHDALLAVVKRLLAASPQAPEGAFPEDARYSLKELRKFL